MRKRLSLAILLAAGLSTSAAAGEMPAGTWLTSEGDAHVQFGPCESGHCGTIVWLKEPMSAIDGQPKRDRYNPDPALQHRPIIGLPVLSRIEVNPEGGWLAHSYDPKKGEEHDITVHLLQSGNLKLTGCALGGLICKSFIWTPVAP